MADWFGSRHDVKWRYMRVSWDSWEEVAEYGNIIGGSDEESYFTSVKTTGTLDYKGDAPDSIDMVRCYYDFTDDYWVRATSPVFTMLVDNAKESYDGSGLKSGSCSLYSVLKLAADRLFGLPFTIPAGTNAVNKAKDLLTELGLRVSVTPSSYTTANDHTFKPGESYLTAVNWLLSAAGYGSASPDAMGYVVLAPYVDSSSREPSFTFEDGGMSIMYPRLDNENNYSETPNVVRMYAEDEFAGYWVKVSNVDPDSPASLVNRGGRELTLYEETNELKPPYDPNEYDELAITHALQRIENLKEIARQKLLDNSAEIEYVEIDNGMYPLSQGDSVEIRYGGMTWRGVVTNVKREHSSESKCTTKVRRYVSHQLVTETEDGVVF